MEFQAEIMRNATDRRENCRLYATTRRCDVSNLYAYIKMSVDPHDHFKKGRLIHVYAVIRANARCKNFTKNEAFE